MSNGLRRPMRLRRSEFTYNACETEDSIYIYQNELDKLCFQHDMTYGLKI